MASNSKSLFSSILVTANGGFKVAAPAKKYSLVLGSVHTICTRPELLAQACSDNGLVGSDDQPAKTFEEAINLFVGLCQVVSTMEEDNQGLALEQQDQSYREYKCVLDAIRSQAGLSIVLKGEVEVDGVSKRTTVFINPERELEGKLVKAGRFNTAILFMPKGSVISAFGTCKPGTKPNELIISGFGVGPHRAEDSEVNQRRAAHQGVTKPETMTSEEFVAGVAGEEVMVEK